MKHSRKEYYQKWYAKRLAEGICRECNNPRQIGKAKCVECAFKEKKQREFLIDRRHCTGCKQKLPKSGTLTCRACSDKQKERNRKHREKIKEIVFSYFGNKCACCNESEQAFLNIDHIKGDGALHRRKENIGTGTNTYSWLIKNSFPSGFQLLCWNCNLGKYRLGSCPHQRKK